MRKIRIVTDSTADIPLELVKEKNIKVTPLTVTYKGVNYRDGFDITTTRLLEILGECDELPKTSQVNPQQFLDCYQELLKEDCEILSIHISSALSGTYQSALIAKDMIGSNRIHVVDSRVVSFGTGILVLEAIKMIEEGADINQIIDRLNNLAQRGRVAFAVDSLEYLRKGGRLSGAQAIIGSLLNIKPILYMTEGRIEVYDKVRGMKKAQNRLIEYMKEEEFDNSLVKAAGNVGCPELMSEFCESIKEELGAEGLMTADVGSVVATYSGPGTLGVFFFKK